MKNLNSLPNPTKEVFLKLATIEDLKDFVFVGGSALSIYLNHRQSEDIDLFTWNKIINSELLLKKLEEEFGNEFIINNLSAIQLDLTIQRVKLTFFANAWKELENSDFFVGNIRIASKEILTAMKLNTLFLRAKFRDYYDLYVINKELFSIAEMYAIIQKYMPKINEKLFQMSLTFVNDIEEDNIKYLKPKYKIKISGIQKHFQNEVKMFLKSRI